MKSVRAMLVAGLLLACGGGVLAKLPPPTPEEEAKAAQAKEKAKAAAEAAEEATKRAQDRVAAHYIAEMKAKGITVNPTPIEGQTTAAVTTAPGKTPAGSDTGQAPEQESSGKTGGGSRNDASGPDTGKHSNR